MSSSQHAIARATQAEWTILRSVRSTSWLLLATVGSTIAFGLLVCTAVDTAGGTPGCVPGKPGCGDEDVVMNSLSGGYLGEIAVIALGVLAATSEYATGTIRSSFAAIPRRSRVVLAKAAVLAATSEYATGTIRSSFAAIPRRSRVVLAKAAVLAAPIFLAGLVGSAVSFLLAQQVLHTNGFIPANGYPLVSLADPSAARAVIGTALYLSVIALLGFAVGTIGRRPGSAIAIVLAIVYAPAIMSLMIADPLRGWLQRLTPMMAGLAVQRTVLRPDSVPIGNWAGLGVAAAWSVVALFAAIWLVQRRDA